MSMDRKGFFGAFLGGAALSTTHENEGLLEGVRSVMRDEFDRMNHARVVTTATQIKRYSLEDPNVLEWVGELSDDGATAKVAWRRAREGEE